MYGHGYDDVDWGVVNALNDEEEDTVLNIYRRGDKVKMSNGFIGYVNSNKMTGNKYNVIGPFRLWSKNNVDADFLTLIQEVKLSNFIVGSAVLKSNRCRITTMKKNRLLGYVVEDSASKGSNLAKDTVSIMFDDNEVHDVDKSNLIYIHEVSIVGAYGDATYMDFLDKSIDEIGIKYLNGEIIQITTGDNTGPVYYSVIHNDIFKTLSEVPISNEWTNS